MSAPTAGFFVNAACTGAPLGPPPTQVARAFHRRLPGYAPTPLRSLPTLARRLEVGEVLIKDETRRLGLPAFKVLGGSWAAYRAVTELLGSSPEPWADLVELRARIAPLGARVLATATSGNHGRGIAWIARLLGLGARIYVPAGTVPSRIRALEQEGAQVIAGGTYEEAMEVSRLAADGGTILVQDNEGEEAVRTLAWVLEGYETLFAEIDEALPAGDAPSTLVLVPIGAAALASAAIAHLRREGAAPVRIVGVEPSSAACALAALRAGRVVALAGEQRSRMAGLNCARIAGSAFPLLREGLNGIVTIEDRAAFAAMETLAAAGIPAGECGAATLAGLEALVADRGGEALRAAVELGTETRVVLLCTEGITS